MRFGRYIAAAIQRFIGVPYGIAGLGSDGFVPLAQLADYVGTTDPTVNNDSADTAALGQKFRAKSLWLNTTTRTIWVCFSAGVGAAAWYVVGEFDVSGNAIFSKLTPRLIAFNDAVTIPAVGEIVVIVNNATTPTAVYGYAVGDGVTARGKSVGSTAAMQSVFAAGTAYTLTTTAALCDFGTTDPSLVLAGPVGTQYLITANLTLRYVGATFAATQLVTAKLRQTAGTAADVTNGSRVVQAAVVTTVSGHLANIVITVPYQVAVAGDTLQLWASIDVLPSAGSVTVTEASIVATPVKQN